MAERFNRTAFLKFAAELNGAIEARRKKYLCFFYLAWVLFAVFLGLSLFMPAGIPMPEGESVSLLTMVLEWDFSYLKASAQSAGSKLPLLYLVALAILAFIGGVFTPVWYRGKNYRVGIIPQSFSLKDAIFSPLLKFFGPWEYAPDASILQRHLHGSKILPDFEEFRAEDLLQGRAHDSLIYLSETALVKYVKGEAQDTFRGLIGVIDISEMGVKLRAPFNGHTVLIADANKSTPHPFKDYARFPMPNASLEDRFEAYTTDIDEAVKILTQPLLETVLNLHRTLLIAQEQHTHRDTVVGFALMQILRNVTSPSRPRLAFEVAYDKEHGKTTDLDKANPLHASAAYYQQELQIECREDKVIITLPCPHDLFEPNSLFEPALVPEDLELLFSIMQTLDTIAAQLDAALQPTPLP